MDDLYYNNANVIVQYNSLIGIEAVVFNIQAVKIFLNNLSLYRKQRNICLQYLLLGGEKRFIQPFKIILGVGDAAGRRGKKKEETGTIAERGADSNLLLALFLPRNIFRVFVDKTVHIFNQTAHYCWNSNETDSSVISEFQWLGLLIRGLCNTGIINIHFGNILICINHKGEVPIVNTIIRAI